MYSLRTPLLVRWPGVTKPGSVNADIVSNLDFAETFLDAAGVAVPAEMQGRSMVPVFDQSVSAPPVCVSRWAVMPPSPGREV